MRLPVSPELIVAELQGVEAIVGKWRKSVEDNQIPAIQDPTEPGCAETDLADYLTECTGELSLAASKLSALAETLANPPVNG